MDLWLMLVMWVSLFDIALAAVLGSRRFDLGFYAGRIFGLIAAGFLLVVLIVEMARTYASAVRAVTNRSHAPQLREGEQPALNVPPAQPLPVETASFIRNQNITHYKKLLAGGQLSETEQ